MLSINQNEINADGKLHTMMVDYSMLGEYLYREIAKEHGEGAAWRFIKRDLPRIIEKGVTNGNSINKIPEDSQGKTTSIEAAKHRLHGLQN